VGLSNWTVAVNTEIVYEDNKSITLAFSVLGGPICIMIIDKG